MAELEVEFQETVAWGREMFVQEQDSIKTELIRRFPTEDFSWIENIFLNEEDWDKDGWEEEGVIEDNPPDQAPSIIANNEIASEVASEVWEEAINDIPPTV